MQICEHGAQLYGLWFKLQVLFFFLLVPATSQKQSKLLLRLIVLNCAKKKTLNKSQIVSGKHFPASA